jgi:hypothetical protein
MLNLSFESLPGHVFSIQFSSKTKKICLEYGMEYTFEILGVSPVLHFFNHQQEISFNNQSTGVEYLGTYQCTLDAFLESIEEVVPKQGWRGDQVVDTVIQFWVNNLDSIQHWKRRLEDAGKENLLVARVADIQSLQAEFERLFGQHT